MGLEKIIKDLYALYGSKLPLTMFPMCLCGFKKIKSKTYMTLYVFYGFNCLSLYSLCAYVVSKKLTNDTHHFIRPH
jgi:hypothetical protein